MNPDPLDRFLQSARRGRATAEDCGSPMPPGLEDSVIRGFRQVRSDEAETLQACAAVLRRAWSGALVAAVLLLGWAQWNPPAAPVHRSALESLFDPSPELDLSLAQP